ncbi:MAG TPA: hypothetical protein VE377_10660 [Candidatus Dormibacteraeota bacterium]|nr:hypothetical protein [Candidatus Dormibacteraeota bacterium]
METLNRLVTESLARHGFDRPVDYRRLQWSRWFRCESPHSLLLVPSKPGVFALAEEIMNLGSSNASTDIKGPRSNVEERRFSTASGAQDSAALAAVSPEAEGRKPDSDSPRRMLAVNQFFEDDDMAFVLDRMLSRENAMRTRLTCGRYFIRYVVIEDQSQRRSICNALNQWIASSAEKATGIGPHFATSLELTPATEQTNASVGRTLLSAAADASTSQKSGNEPVLNKSANTVTPPEVVAATDVHRSSLFPSGF